VPSEEEKAKREKGTSASASASGIRIQKKQKKKKTDGGRGSPTSPWESSARRRREKVRSKDYTSFQSMTKRTAHLREGQC
jgi:hypothetical protein